MANDKDEEKGTYYTKDSLKNFYIKVELHKVTASGAVGMLGDTGRLTASRASTIGAQDPKVWIFQWQEKVFSQHEDEYYADANNCCTALQDQYHREILKLRREGGRPNVRLFSHVDSDQYQLPEKEASLEKGTLIPTFASRYGNSVRKRHITRGVPKSVIRDPVLEPPTDEQRRTHRINTPHSQSMFLMADLRKFDNVDPADEHSLCHITVNSNGMVTMTPDFNRDKPAHRIENTHKEVFEYRLEIASEGISQEEEIKERKVQYELYSRHANYLKACVGTSFSPPPEEDALRIQLLGEIVSAKGFEYDDLYVKAQLELPEFWQLEDQGDRISANDLSVVSQICRTKSRHKYNIAYFGYPFEFQLTCSPLPEEHHLPKCPRLLIEVSSLDYWERHRVEGYGYIDLPSKPGSFDLIVNTWRPSGNGLVDQMRRYFVGGAPQISEMSYISCPKDFQGSHLSKYGFRTESSGSVKIHLESIHQSSVINNKTVERVTESIQRNGFRSAQAMLGALWSAKRRANTITTSTH